MLPHEVHHSRTMVLLPSVVLDHKGPIFLGGALKGLWPHKLEDVVFIQTWVLEGWSDPWVDHEILQLHNYKNMVLT